MLGKNKRRASGPWILLGFALALAGCTEHTTEPGAGSGGTDQAISPVGGGTGGVAPAVGSGGAAAPVGVATGGIGASGAGGSVIVGAGGAPPLATDGSGGGEAPPAGDAGPPPPPRDLGVGDGSDVVTIGDSWMNILTNGGGIEGGLDRLDTNYRHYAVAGTLLSGTIPTQYDQAKAANPSIATVIMTGGGNDIMFSGGCNTKEACTESVKMIVAMLDELWTKMADDGVTDVFYISYSKNVGTAPADTRPDTPPDPPTICLSGRIACHTVNTTDLIAATDSLDGIHPTSAGCDRIAARVLEQMEMTGARR